MVILATSERRSLVVDEPVNFRKGTIVRLVKGQDGDPMDGTAKTSFRATSWWASAEGTVIF